MKNNALPDRSQALEIVLRIEAPFQVLAWIMLETGAKFSDIQSLRVRDIRLDRGMLICGGRSHEMSAGLMEAIDEYLRTILRPAFEQLKRLRESAPFASRRFFPAWILDGYEHLPVDAALPLAEYVAALQAAASRAGFHGIVNSNTLRLVTAREWLAQGMPLPELHQRLGHGDIMTTMLLAQTLQYGGLTFAVAA